MSDEEVERLCGVLAEMDATTDELKAAVMFLIYAFALKFNATNDLLYLARTLAKKMPDNPATQRAAELFEHLLSPIQPK